MELSSVFELRMHAVGHVGIWERDRAWVCSEGSSVMELLVGSPPLAQRTQRQGGGVATNQELMMESEKSDDFLERTWWRPRDLEVGGALPWDGGGRLAGEAGLERGEEGLGRRRQWETPLACEAFETAVDEDDERAQWLPARPTFAARRSSCILGRAGGGRAAASASVRASASASGARGEPEIDNGRSHGHAGLALGGGSGARKGRGGGGLGAK